MPNERVSSKLKQLTGLQASNFCVRAAFGRALGESEPNRGRPNHAAWRAYDKFAPGILANAASRCTESSPFRSATLTCARRCAPSSVHRICCLYGRLPMCKAFFSVMTKQMRLQVYIRPVLQAVDITSSCPFRQQLMSNTQAALKESDANSLAYEKLAENRAADLDVNC
jgi:hypothetical protein